jgi:hypothetical protein
MAQGLRERIFPRAEKVVHGKKETCLPGQKDQEDLKKEEKKRDIRLPSPSRARDTEPKRGKKQSPAQRIVRVQTPGFRRLRNERYSSSGKRSERNLPIRTRKAHINMYEEDSMEIGSPHRGS